MRLTVNIREKKIKGLVKPKGEGSVFRDSLLKGIILFIYKGAHGSGWVLLGWAWGFGRSRWVVLNFLLFGLSGREPEYPSSPNIHIITREGAVRGGLKPATSHRW